MYYLSDEQIACIANRLSKDKINYSHLFEDLLDHVCCDIEKCMQNGLDYNQALQKIFEEIGLNGLREIQEATIFYVKFNLIIMKKLMHVLAIIGSSILVTGLLFKLNHWAGGSILFSLAFLVLFLGFFPTALFNIRKELKLNFFSKQFGVYFIGFLTIFVNGLSTLFTMMHWPGAKVLTLSAWVLIFFLFFPILFYQIIKSKNNRTVNVGLAIYAFLFLGTLTVGHYNSRTNTFNTFNFAPIDQELNYYKTGVNYHYLKLLSENIKYDIDKVNQQKTILLEIEKMILEYENSILNGKEDIYMVVKSYLHNTVVSEEFDNNFSSLRAMLNTYRGISIQLCSGNSSLQELVNHKTSTDPVNIKTLGPTDWTKRNFYGPDNLYISLHKILKDVYQVQYEVLRNIEINGAPEL